MEMWPKIKVFNCLLLGFLIDYSWLAPCIYKRRDERVLGALWARCGRAVGALWARCGLAVGARWARGWARGY
jgi:hypothetical protein